MGTYRGKWSRTLRPAGRRSVLRDQIESICLDTRGDD